MIFAKPIRFVELNETIVWKGTTLKAVRRPYISQPFRTCEGCYLNSSDAIQVCNRMQCSSFDRIDRTSIWFVKEK